MQQLVLACLASSLLCGLAGFVAAIVILMQLGLRWHDNYEYYGSEPWLYFGPAALGLIIGFCLPILLMRLIGRRSD